MITNSVKHAFNEHEQGLISIHFSETPERRIVLHYSDNGMWQEDPETLAGFGMELIGLLASQLEGEFTRIGSTYQFDLGNLDH